LEPQAHVNMILEVSPCLTVNVHLHNNNQSVEAV
jgi:hypothetical protein